MKPTYEELEEKCALQQSKLEAINKLMGVVETASDIAKAAVAELEARCAALAAENAQMLRLLTDISENHDEYVNQDEYLYAGVPMDYVSEINMYVSRDVEAENPFAATDAFLAEVRAQGADAVAAYHAEREEALREIAPFASRDHKNARIHAMNIAALLRQEAK